MDFERCPCSEGRNLKHQISFVLLWTIPAVWVRLGGGDEKLSSVMVVVLLQLLLSSDTTLYNCFSLSISSWYNFLGLHNFMQQLSCIKRPVSQSFQSTVVKTDSKVSKLAHFLLFSFLFFHFFKVVLSINSLPEQGSTVICNKPPFIDCCVYVYFPTVMIKLFLNEFINTTF